MSAVRGWANETGSRHRRWQGWFTSRALHPQPGQIETDSMPLSAKSGYPSQCASHQCCGRMRDWCLVVNDEDKMAVKIMGIRWEGKKGTQKIWCLISHATQRRSSLINASQSCNKSKFSTKFSLYINSSVFLHPGKHSCNSPPDKLRPHKSLWSNKSL